MLLSAKAWSARSTRFATGHLAEKSAPFDLVLLDPPYDRRPGGSGDPGGPGDFDTVLAAAGEVVAADGLLVLEHSRKRATPEAAGVLVRTREVMSGDSALTLYAVKR